MTKTILILTITAAFVIGTIAASPIILAANDAKVLEMELAVSGSNFPVTVDIENKKGKSLGIPTQNIASSGDTFTIANTDFLKNKYESKTFYIITDASGAVTKIEIHTSCSQPLGVGDIFPSGGADPQLTVIGPADKICAASPSDNMCDVTCPAGPGQVPIGTVLSYAGSTAPTNFMIADGSEISRTTFSALFNIIGTTYGAGDGSTTFNLPDLSDSFVRGKTTGTPGSTGGSDSHTHDVDPPLRTSSTTSGHIHGIDPPGISSSNKGNHQHGIVSGTESTSFNSHNHFVPSASTSFFADCESNPCSTASTSGHTHSITGSGNHQHTVQIRTNTDFEQAHNHFTDITPFSSATSGFHNHQTDIAPFSSASADSKPPFIELVMVIKVQ